LGLNPLVGYVFVRVGVEEIRSLIRSHLLKANPVTTNQPQQNGTPIRRRFGRR
jgi:hypothetical protein